MYLFIELLRALAAMLTTNSHFDGVYPWNISWGGSGCSLILFDKWFCSCKERSKGKFLPLVVEESDSFIYSTEYSESCYSVDRLQNAVN